MKSKISVLTIGAFVSFAANPVFAARGTEGGGGGNRYGLEAAAAMRLVPIELKRLGRDLVTNEQLEEIAAVALSENTLVLMVQQPPVSKLGEATQRDTAYSTSGEAFDLIEVHEESWIALKGNQVEQIPFMAHEIAVLLGFERTGGYGKISAELLNRIRQSGLAPDASPTTIAGRLTDAKHACDLAGIALSETMTLDESDLRNVKNQLLIAIGDENIGRWRRQLEDIAHEPTGQMSMPYQEVERIHEIRRSKLLKLMAMVKQFEDLPAVKEKIRELTGTGYQISIDDLNNRDEAENFMPNILYRYPRIRISKVLADGTQLVYSFYTGPDVYDFIYHRTAAEREASVGRAKDRQFDLQTHYTRFRKKLHDICGELTPFPNE